MTDFTKVDEEETYLAQGFCTNCGRRNYPQWGTYEVGKALEEYPCPQCGMFTWKPESIIEEAVRETIEKIRIKEGEEIECPLWVCCDSCYEGAVDDRLDKLFPTLTKGERE